MSTKKRKYPHLLIKEKEKTTVHKHPKRVKVVTTYDLGDKIIREISSMNPTMETITIPKKANPNLTTLLEYPVKIRAYKNTGMCFVSDLDGKPLGSFRKYTLKKLYSEIGNLFKAQKKAKVKL